MAKKHRIIPHLTPQDADRFWSKVNVLGPDDCWEWQSTCGRGGYGRFTLQGSAIFAHRLAWHLANGPIPGQLCVCHKCDNPPCCNPNHLFLGTQLDNIQDRTTKGRTVSLSGERHYGHKLTEADVIKIRQALRSQTRIKKALAAKFGVTRQNIRRIEIGRTWKHLQPA